MDVVEVLYQRLISAILEAIAECSVKTLRKAHGTRGLKRAETKLFCKHVAGLNQSIKIVKRVYRRYKRDIADDNNKI